MSADPQFREKIEAVAVLVDGRPCLRLTSTRGEAKKRTLGPHVERLAFDPLTAIELGEALAALGRRALAGLKLEAGQ